MKAVIEQGIINGVITAPPSKSITQRAYAAALLHHGRTVIHNSGFSADELAALGIIQQLGAAIIQQSADKIIIESAGIAPSAGHINCGESGLAARLFTPLASLSAAPITITGTGSLLRRPMEGFAAALPALGIQLYNFTGYLPLHMQGPLAPVSISIDGSTGSQLLSGLLFAYAYSATAPVTIAVQGLKSTPYIDLTLEVLKQYGRPIRHNGYKKFFIDPALFTSVDSVEINVEGDWSSAATLLVAGAIAGTVTVEGISIQSRQADRQILDVLQRTGTYLSLRDNSVTATQAELRAFDFNATHCPDLFPILAILAACCDGESSIAGVHRLFYKESNRVESITEMLQDFDVPFSVEEDTLYVTGVNNLQGTVIDGYNDHRIVMAATIGALRAKGPVGISGVKAVNKSYPRFFEDVKKIGGKVEIA